MTKNEKSLMEHAIGLDDKSFYVSHGEKYYIPYRNYYGAGGEHKTWEGLCDKGLAKTNDHRMYYVTLKGLAELSEEFGIYCYSECAYAMYESKLATFHAILDNDAAIVAHWAPVSSKQIAKRARLPITRVREALKELKEEGYVCKDYVGGQDEDGTIFCFHGYTATELGEKDPYFKETNEKEVARVYAIMEGEQL